MCTYYMQGDPTYWIEHSITKGDPNNRNQKWSKKQE